MIRSEGARRISAPRGFALVEALMAAALLGTALAGTAQLLIWSRRAVWTSGAEVMSTVLAVQKIEQLRALTWHVDGDGLAVSDVTTTLATDPPSDAGRGLANSPEGTLDRATAGYVDYLDARGAWRGAGSRPPAGAVFVRRWSVAPLAADPLHTLVFQVRVLPLAEDAPGGRTRARHEAHLTTIKTRSLP